MRDAKLLYPIILILFFSIILSGSENAEFPPCSAARSHITEPGFIDKTISSVIILGAFLPGMSAVQIIIS